MACPGGADLLALTLALSSAIAADEPCYGHQHPNRVSSDHFWVEWSGDVIDEGDAENILGWAEDARSVYVDELGFAFTDQAIVLRVDESTIVSPGGQTQSRDCDGGDVPLILLFTDGLAGDAEGLVAHELGHAVQYAYMGDYQDSVASWIWWMEGMATWITVYADGDLGTWADRSDAFLYHPEIALHLNAAAFIVPDRSNHMYGSAVLAQYMDEVHGGPTAIRATWEYGAALTGEPIWFPDAVAAAGLEWDGFWQGFLAAATTGDLENGSDLGGGARVSAEVTELPASGQPSAEEEEVPEGLGFAVVHFAPEAGARKRAIEVSFDGDPSVPWHVVLVRTFGSSAGSRVVDYVPLEVDANGHAEGWLTAMDGELDGFLVASPESMEQTPFTFAWSADLIDDPGPMAGTVTLSEWEAQGCGCATPAMPAVGPFAMLLALIGLRRRPR